MKKNLLTTLLLLSFIFSFAQASLVKDIMVGSTNGININTELFEYNDMVLFKSFGGEIAVSDGTNAGTFPINIGIGRADPEEFTLNPVTNEVYFSAQGPGVNDLTVRELWKTNGTAAGTMLAHDYTPFAGWSSRPTDICVNNGVVFCAVEQVGAGDELGFSDPINSNSSTIQIIPGTSGSYPENLISYNGLVYFSASGPTWARELCVSDGTPAGTVLLKNLNLSGFGDPADFVIFNNKLYFTANNGANGRELWATNGTSAGTYMVSDINTGANGSDPGNFQVFGNRLFFSATSDSNGRELYYMLTNEAVILYRDINPGPASSNPSNITPYSGYIYFNADNGTDGAELWRSDGSIFGIGLFKDINTSGSSSPVSFQKYNGKLYFAANDGTNGEELWITDGTSNGTVLAADINPGAASSEPRFLVEVDDELLFHANDGTTGRELWKYVDPVLSTEDFDIGNAATIYPNPTQDVFNVETQFDIETVTVYDLQGKLSKQFNGYLSEYNIEDLTSGLYFIQIVTDNGQTTIKLLKN